MSAKKSIQTVSVLKIHKLTQEQYDEAYRNGEIETGLYLTPDDSVTKEYVDSLLSGSSDGTIDLSNYYTKTEADNRYVTKAELTTAIGEALEGDY